MLRKLALSVLITTIILVACGRQVTPNPPTGPTNGVQAGHMLIKFRTANPMNFNTVRYLIVFNTSGNGGAPYTNAYNTGYKNMNFVLAVGGSGGSVAPAAYQIIPAPIGSGGQPYQQPLNATGSQLALTLNTNGANTEFTIVLDRTLLFGVGTPAPTTAPQSTWQVNFFTTDTSSNPLDALGTGGATDTSFRLDLPVNTTFDFQPELTVPVGATQAGIPAAQLAGGEITNSP